MPKTKKLTKSEIKYNWLVSRGKLFAAQNRKKLTKWEKILMQLLQDCHIPFKTQYWVVCRKAYLYIGDFYLTEIGYFFEANGQQHYTKENRKYDNRRKARLKKEGIMVVEFANKQISLLTKENLLSIYNSLLQAKKENGR